MWSMVFYSAHEPIPSFALMDIQGQVITTYVYQLIENEVRVEKVEFRCVSTFLRSKLTMLTYL